MSAPWGACLCSAQKPSTSQVRPKLVRPWGLARSTQLYMTSTDASLASCRHWVAELLGTSGPNTCHRGKPRALRQR